MEAPVSARFHKARQFGLSLYRQRWLLLQFIRRELGSRYAGSTAGALWAVAHPLLQLAIYALVFEGVFRVRLPPEQNYPYLLFVAVGLWPWLAFQEAVVRGTQAVVNNAALVKKIPFSHELLVVASVTSVFFIHLCGYLIVLALMSVLGYSMHWSGLPWVALIVVLLYLFSLALALALAALHVFVRDVEQILVHGLSLLFYVSPILYSGKMIPAWLSDIMKLNPLSHYFETIRMALLDGKTPAAAEIGLLIAFSVAALAAGVALFRRMSPHFEDAL